MGIIDINVAAHRLAGEVASARSVQAPGPGHSRHDRSLLVTLDPKAPDGFLCHSFAGDPWQLCRDHVRKAIGLPFLGYRIATTRSPSWSASSYPDVSNKEDGETRRHRAINLWGEALSLRATIGETYLRRRIGRSPLELIDTDRVLRFHPRAPVKLADGSVTRLPCLVALMRHTRTNEVMAVHRTFLEADGSKKSIHPALGNPKKMLGVAKNAAIKLSADECVLGGLGICEGLETGLSIMVTGFAPVWAMGSAGAISRLSVLPHIESLTIFADSDANGTGPRAARQCASWWSCAKTEVMVMIPPEIGTDFNDAFQDLQ